MPSAQFQFSTGVLWVTPVDGNQSANPTSQQIGTLQDASCDFSGDVKTLVGANQYPDDVAVGEKKVSGKFSYGRIDPQMFNQVFFADTSSTGTINNQWNEAHNVPSSTPWQVTIAPPSSGTFSSDLGVIYASGANAGVRLQKVASGPTLGQYSVAAGVYTFATADANAAIWISYQYTVSATGNTYQINNQPMGYGPVVSLDFFFGYKSGYQGVPNALGIHLYAARINKLSLAAKNTDYTKPEMDFMAFANAAGQVGYWIVN